MPASVCFEGKEYTTAIFKRPVDGTVAVNLLNLGGDGQADLKVHGGRNKAVYIYPACHYVTWEQELGRGALEAAQFGENLTVGGLNEETVIIGDQFRIGSATVVVTQPRLPCFKLGIRMNDKDFPKRFLASGRLGFYLRVLETGELQTGDALELLERDAYGISVHGLWQLVFGAEKDAATAAHALQVLPHIDAGWQRRLRMISGCRATSEAQ
jgi:MOSC domain-containing protein YiiM